MKRFFLGFLCAFFVCCSTYGVDRTSNSVIVCENSLEMLDWDLEFMSHAQQSIELSACYSGGTVLKKILSVMEKRLKECPHIQIHLLAWPIFFDDEDKAIVARLQNEYPKNFHLQLTTSVMRFIPDYTAIDHHVKCLIVDETYFSVGGTNFDEVLCTDGKYTPPRNPKRENAGVNLPGGPAGVRDQDIVGRGPIAKELRVTFFQLYTVWEEYFKSRNSVFQRNPEFFKDVTRYFLLNPEESLAFVDQFETAPQLIEAPQIKMFLSGSMHSPNRITKEYERLIKGAKKEIFIGNLYFSPVNAILDSLLDAANRGVDISVITNGVGKHAPSYTKFFAWANRIHYVPLFYGRNFHFWEVGQVAKAPLRNTHIYEYAVIDVVYHKKVMVVDGRYTVIGSYNLGMRSDKSDFELVVVIDSPAVAAEVLKVLKVDRGLSQQVTPKEAKDWYFDPLVSCLANTQKKFHGLL